MRIDHIRVVAKQALLDMIRDRGTIVSLFLQPILFLIVMGFVGYVIEQRQAAYATDVFKAAVVGPASDVRPFVELLEDHRFQVRSASDVDRAIVGGDIEIALRVPANTLRDMRAGMRTKLEIIFTGDRDQSQVAMSRARVALGEFGRREVERRLARRGLSKDFAAPIDVDETNASTTQRGGRIQLARLLPGILLLQSTGLMSAAATRIGGSKEKRTFEPLIILPIRRSDLLAGLGVASFMIGSIPALAFVAPVVVISLLPIALANGLTSPVIVGSALLLAGIPFAMLLSAGGIALGTAARTSGAGSAMSTVAFVPLFALGFAFTAVDSLPSGLGFTAIPAYGAALFLRESIIDGVDPLQFAVLLASTVASAALLLLLARSLLETERAVLRPS